jgi:hypothetical protein
MMVVMAAAMVMRAFFRYTKMETRDINNHDEGSSSSASKRTEKKLLWLCCHDDSSQVRTSFVGWCAVDCLGELQSPSSVVIVTYSLDTAVSLSLAAPPRRASKCS